MSTSAVLDKPCWCKTLEVLPNCLCATCGDPASQHELVFGQLQGGDDWSAHIFETCRCTACFDYTLIGQGKVCCECHEPQEAE